MTTKLAASIAGGAAAPAIAKPPVGTRLAAALAGVRPWRPIVVPLLGVDAALRLVGTTRQIEIEAETTAVMESRRLEQTSLTLTAWELERSVRLITDAVLELDAEKRTDAPAFGTRAEWGDLPAAVIVELRRMYDDFAELHDPSLAPLDPVERAFIDEAVKKKEPTALRYFGARKLAAWLTSTDVQLASSIHTKSSPGDSSPDTSTLPDT